ncbi:MAG: protoporphyrinogen oxidase [Planctomycetaceae bacterium]|jgi:oxygen-dependent protoporphyrinogen oxidase|nr:protoporphyrinogen oxidase [Planctomycetaceae bacterium]
MNIAIIGAGISGLSAAYHLRKTLPSAAVHLFECRSRIGGVIQSVNQNGYQIELGPDNFITTVPWGVALCKELGLERQLLQTNPKYRRTYIVRNDNLYLMPDGFLMMAPTKLVPLALTPLLSPFGKIRAAMELFIPNRKDDRDETMSHFVKRRLGREVFERLVEPLVSGIYAADMDKLSVLATLPRFREMEREHGSLIRAMQKQLKVNRSAHLEEQSGARYSMFITLKNGLATLCETLAKKLPKNCLNLNVKVKKITKSENGKWNVETTENGTKQNHYQFDKIILAVPAHEAAVLLQESMPALSEKLAKIPYEGTAIVSFAFDEEQMKRKVNGMGFVVPKREHSPILAGSFSSLKYEGRAPEGKLLLRIFAGGARFPEAASMPDKELVPLLQDEIRHILKIDGEPLLTKIAHWENTMPQYYVGHRELAADIQSLVNAEPALALAGNYFNGVGIPNCIKSGTDAAEKFIG